MSPLPRGVCPVCGAVAGVRHGLMVLHSAPYVVSADALVIGQEHMTGAVGGSAIGLCSGSGEPSVGYTVRGVESAVVKGLY